MGFGFFKKLKDGFNKARKFISNKVINPAVNMVKKVQPVLKKLDLNTIKPIVDGFNPNLAGKIDKLDQIKNKAIEYSDDVINLDNMVKNKDYTGAIEYAGHQFIPRLKH